MPLLEGWTDVNSAVRIRERDKTGDCIMEWREIKREAILDSGVERKRERQDWRLYNGVGKG